MLILSGNVFRNRTEQDKVVERMTIEERLSFVLQRSRVEGFTVLYCKQAKEGRRLS